MKKTLLTFLVSCLALGLTSFVAAQELGQQFEGFNLEGYTDGGEKAWDVTGDTADVLGDNIAITNVDANRFGEEDINLKARKGTLNKTSGDVLLEEDVVITAETGGQIKTDSLNWQKEKDLVSTEDQVVITDERLRANGQGLEAHPGQRTATLKKDVTVTVKPENRSSGGEVITVTSDGPMEIEQANHFATFTDNVVAVYGDKTLKSDKMEVYFDPDTQNIKQAICIGHVEILQGDNVTYSDRAVYSAYDQKLTLTGRPKLIMIPKGEGSL